jgi:glycosyltransferase involved in cell wall biosynthesis
LAISEFSRKEGMIHLCLEEAQVNNVSTAIEPQFQPLKIPEETAAALYKKFNITRPYTLYTGGADDRKNLPRLIQAYAALPCELRHRHQLLFAGNMQKGHITEFQRIATQAGLETSELCFTGYVSDQELIQLYNLCELFVFPSWHEGFGLPALEAMACGAPVIGANNSSLPEVIGLDEALFDPLDVDSISKKIYQALTDTDFRKFLREHGRERAKLFSWDETSRRAIADWETLASSDQAHSTSNTFNEERLIKLLAVFLNEKDEATLLNLSTCIAMNHPCDLF